MPIVVSGDGDDASRKPMLSLSLLLCACVRGCVKCKCLRGRRMARMRQSRVENQKSRHAGSSKGSSQLSASLQAPTAHFGTQSETHGKPARGTQPLTDDNERLDVPNLRLLFVRRHSTEAD